ncbi:hypothetical protein C8Q70DRAFT_1056687 [Cubamyces menziesii]|nr:hypothetical protein C8Q70DRAFT_1056687 [Cubamyces menziesii]
MHRTRSSSTTSTHASIRRAVRVHLEYLAAVKLRRVLPFGKPGIFDVCFALYTNIEAKERIEEIDATTGLDDAINIIRYAIVDAGVQSELLWWYDRAGLQGVNFNYPC